MERKVNDALAALPRKLDAIRDEARSLSDIAADVARYTAERLRDRHRGSDVGSDPVAAVLDQIILEAGHRLIDLKQELSICIADERRLVNVVEHAAKNAAEWARLTTAAEDQGNQELVAEARERERMHTEQGRRYQAQLERQKVHVESLSHVLRSLSTGSRMPNEPGIGFWPAGKRRARSGPRSRK